MTLLEQTANNLHTVIKRTNGDWFTRTQLSKLLQKRIQMADTLALDFLQITGTVEVKKVAIRGGIKERFEYRLKQVD